MSSSTPPSPIFEPEPQSPIYDTEPNAFVRFWIDVGRCLRRVVAINFQKTRVTDREAAKLASSATPITETVGQSYAAWRRSALWIAGVALFVHVIILFSTFRFQETQVRNAVAVSERKQLDQLRKANRRNPMEVRQMAMQNPMTIGPRYAAIQSSRAEREYIKRMQDTTVKNFGASNLAMLDAIILIGNFVVLVCAVLVILSAVFWNRLRRSKWLARIGWLVLFLSPVLLGLLPLSQLMDFGHVDPQFRKGIVYAIGAMFAIQVFAKESVKVLAVFPGIIRSSMGLKTLLPESAVPGWIVALIAPIYMLFVLLFVVTVNQLQGGWLLMSAAVCLMAAPAVYLFFGKVIVQPRRADEIGSVVNPIRMAAAGLSVVGLVLFSFWVLDLPGIDLGDVFKIVFGLIANVLLLTVVVTDFIVEKLHTGYIQSRGFEGTRQQETLDRRFAALAQFGRASTDTGTPAPPPLQQTDGVEPANPFDAPRESDDSLVLPTGEIKLPPKT